MSEREREEKTTGEKRPSLQQTGIGSERGGRRKTRTGVTRTHDATAKPIRLGESKATNDSIFFDESLLAAMNRQQQ